MSWQGPTRIIESNSWLHARLPKIKPPGWEHCLNSGRLSAVTIALGSLFHFCGYEGLLTFNLPVGTKTDWWRESILWKKLLFPSRTGNRPVVREEGELNVSPDLHDPSPSLLSWKGAIRKKVTNKGGCCPHRSRGQSPPWKCVVPKPHNSSLAVGNEEQQHPPNRHLRSRLLMGQRLEKSANERPGKKTVITGKPVWEQRTTVLSYLTQRGDRTAKREKPVSSWFIHH